MRPTTSPRRGTGRARRPATAFALLAALLSALLAALAVGAVMGCEATALRLLVAADLAVPDEADALVVTVRGDGEVESSRFALEEEADALRESLTLLPGERMRQEVQVEVGALLGGREVAKGSAASAFREGATQELVVTLTPVVAPPDAGPGDDAGPRVDAGPVDAGPDDAGQPDAGPRRCIDNDGDGYGDGPDCIDYDCDDDDPNVHPGAEEVCNGIDDDCDFAVDEGCPCPLAGSNICGSLRGECRGFGVQVCVGDVWSECDGARLPSLEICNGKDDDCDGQVDEGCE